MNHKQHNLRTDESEEVNTDSSDQNLNCQGIFERMKILMFKRMNYNQDNTNPYANNIRSNKCENNFCLITKSSESEKIEEYVPSPDEVERPKFIYTLNSGDYLVLKNPLPPELSPDDALSYMNARIQFDGHQQIEMEEDTSSFEERCFDENRVESRDIKYYIIVTIIPVTGILIYCFLKSDRPKFAKHLLNYMFGCFIIIGSLLLIILI